MGNPTSVIFTPVSVTSDVSIFDLTCYIFGQGRHNKEGLLARLRDDARWYLQHGQLCMLQLDETMANIYVWESPPRKSRVAVGFYPIHFRALTPFHR